MATPRIDRFERNQAYNTDFNLWQRGSSINRTTTGGDYLADRWTSSINISSGTPTVVYSKQTDSPNNNSRFCAQLQATTGATFATYALFHIWETGDSRNLINKSIAIGFWYKSNRTGAHACAFTAGIGGTSNTDTQEFTVNVANTWEYKVKTFTTSGVIPRTDGENLSGCQLVVGLIRSGVGQGVLANNDYFKITQVSVVDRDSTIALDGEKFSLRGGGATEELTLCQRYFEVFGIGGHGRAIASTDIRFACPFKVTKRATPAVTIKTGSTQQWNDVAIANKTSTSTVISVFASGVNGVADTNITGFTGLTAASMYQCATDVYLADAEL